MGGSVQGLGVSLWGRVGGHYRRWGDSSCCSGALLGVGGQYMGPEGAEGGGRGIWGRGATWWLWGSLGAVGWLWGSRGAIWGLGGSLGAGGQLRGRGAIWGLWGNLGAVGQFGGDGAAVGQAVSPDGAALPRQEGTAPAPSPHEGGLWCEYPPLGGAVAISRDIS